MLAPIEVSSLDENKDYMVKSARFDPYAFWGTLIESLTHTESKATQPRAPLRRGKHKAFTVFASGVYPYGKQPSPYPVNEEYKKAFLSRHQSTSLVTKEAQVPVFYGLNSKRKEMLAGVILDPDDALVNRYFIYDMSTVERSYEFNSEVDANKYHTENAGKKLFADRETFKKAIQQDAKKHNEVLARIRWNTQSSAIGIFSDTDESRYVAMFYADELRQVLKSKAGKLPEPWDDNYEVPIYYYIPESPINYHRYTKTDQLLDRKKANTLLADKTKREEAFNNGYFACLLLAEEPHTALDIEFNKYPIIVELIKRKLFHIADALVKRSHCPDLATYLKNKNLTTTIENIFDDNDIFLVHSCITGRADLVKHIISVAPKLLKVNNHQGYTALTAAATNGLKEIVELLLKDSKLDLNATDKDGRTALIAASTNGHKEVVALLLAASKMDLNVQGKNGSTALMASNGFKQFFASLFTKPKLDLNATNKDGHTALIAAATKGHKEVVVLLLAAPKIDLNAQDKDERTALMAAASNGHKEVVELLLAAPKIDLNAYDKDLCTVLYAAAVNGHKEIVEILLKDSRLNPFREDNYGRSVLIAAASKGHKITVELLLKDSRCMPKVRNEDGCTALIGAATYGSKETVELLLKDSRFDPNEKNNSGYTALISAATYGHKETVELLLKDSRVDPNAKDNSGCTALIRAVVNGRKETVERLLTYSSVNLNAKNRDESTALDYAKKLNHLDIANMLYLPMYIQERSQDKGIYFFSGSLFNNNQFDKNVKVEAAKYALKVYRNESIEDVSSADRKLYLAACSQGKLGRYCKEMNLLSKLLSKIEAIPANSIGMQR